MTGKLTATPTINWHTQSARWLALLAALYTGLQISSANAQDADLRRPATAFNVGAEPTNGPAQGNSPEVIIAPMPSGLSPFTARAGPVEQSRTHQLHASPGAGFRTKSADSFR